MYLMSPSPHFLGFVLLLSYVSSKELHIFTMCSYILIIKLIVLYMQLHYTQIYARFLYLV